MRLGDSHLTEDESRVTVGGMLQRPPGEILNFVLIADTPAGIVSSTSAPTPHHMLLLLSQAQMLVIRGVFFDGVEGEGTGA